MQYKRLGPEDLRELGRVVGAENMLLGNAISEEYSHDEMEGVHAWPEVVLLPATTDEVSAILQYAWGQGIPVTPRGAGTGLVGGAVPTCGGILLDLSGMNRIVELDKANLTLTVEPGALLMDITAYVEEQGLFYPPDPGEKSATIGGNISTNAGGMRAVKYGVTRDYVRALEVVLPDGQVMWLGGKTVKNCSGYALKDLMVGSEGTLGVITKAVLRLLPLPAETVSLLVPFPSLQQAIDTVPHIVCSQHMPTAIEFIEREVLLDAEEYLGKTFPDHSSDAYLLLKFDGQTVEEIERSYDGIAKLCLGQGALDVLISDTEEREEAIWSARGAFLEAIKNATSFMDEVDVVVPRSSVNELVQYVYTLRETEGIRIKCFGHAGDGNLHAYILKDGLADEEWQRKVTAVMDKIYAKARQLRGEVSGEHGIGYVKRSYLAQSISPETMALMAKIKDVFDAKRILNPEKVLWEETAG